jgi:predicted ATPase/serine/threonine protein kinase/Tfp pilus assembly protein PilF
VTPERWMLIKRLLQQALERPAAERPAFLALACEGDASLREEVEAYLAWHDSADRFLEVPPLAPDLARTRAGEDPATGVAPNETAGRPKVCARCGARFEGGSLICPSDGELLVEDRDWLVGRTLDGLYRIEALVGRGGMGVVYRARHVLLEDRVAIKVLSLDVSRNPDWLQRFVREGRAARRFRHPNAVAVHDLRVGDAGAYLVLEYVEGRTLRAELKRRGPLTPAEVVELLEPVASALDAAHASGVVHRDVKPENVMLSGERGTGVEVKVLDFGIAKLGEIAGEPDSPALTAPGLVLGTVVYMSPEQWGVPSRDGVGGVDGRADVYSLGVMAYEMVCGSVPFRGDSATEFRREHVGSEPPPVHERVARVSDGFGRAIARALAKDRGDRPATAGEFVGELRAALEPICATGVTWIAATGEAAGGVHTLANGLGIRTGPAPVAAATAGRDVPNNLPRQITRFIGREDEVAEVRALLSGERLVTLTGMGGIGKTRLALKAAAEAVAVYGDGVWFVELASVADPTLVPHAVAQALGVREEANRAVLDSVTEWLKAKHALLVVDNCEHLVGACAAAVDALLRSCADLRVLVTSREALGIGGEALFRLSQLGTPDPAASEPVARLIEYDAVRLFVDRVRVSRPRYEISDEDAASIAAICRKLDGIPLALELAAARTRVLSLEQIRSRLDDRFRLLTGGSRTAHPRQQTLRAAIDWSYDLLTEQERVLLPRLAVFAGGWSLEAAEAVCAGAGVEAGDVLELLSRLVDTSLVAAEERERQARFTMLETIRAYALELLARDPRADEVRGRHARYYLALGESAGPALDRVMTTESVQRLEAEHDNVRAALAWLLEHDADGCVRLAAAMVPFWHVHGHLSEGRRWLEVALERGDTAPGGVRVSALRRAALIAVRQGDLAAARVFLERSVRLARGAGDPTQVAASCWSLGALAMEQGDLAAARAHVEESLTIGREAGSDIMVAECLNLLGEVTRLEGNLVEARSLYEQAVALYDQLGSQPGVSAGLLNLGTVSCEEGELPEASAYYRQALTYAQAYGSKGDISLAFDGLAAVAAKRGAWERAARLAGAAEVAREAVSARLNPADRAFREQYLARVSAALGEAPMREAAAEGRAIRLEQAIEYALSDGQDIGG